MVCVKLNNRRLQLIFDNDSRRLSVSNRASSKHHHPQSDPSSFRQLSRLNAEQCNINRRVNWQTKQRPRSKVLPLSLCSLFRVDRCLHHTLTTIRLNHDKYVHSKSRNDEWMSRCDVNYWPEHDRGLLQRRIQRNIKGTRHLSISLLAEYALQLAYQHDGSLLLLF